MLYVNQKLVKGAEWFQERDKWIFEDAQHGILSIFLILYSREWRKLFRFWSWSRNPEIQDLNFSLAYDWISTQIESSDWLSEVPVSPGASDDWHIWVGHAGPHYTDIRLTQATIWHEWEEASSGPDQGNPENVWEKLEISSKLNCTIFYIFLTKTQFNSINFHFTF